MKANTNREIFKNYVKNGSDRPFVSMQVGAGAGFDTKLAGKKWNSEGTLEDTVRAYEIIGGLPLFNIGLPDMGNINPALKRTNSIKSGPDERIITSHLTTPYGDLNWTAHEVPKQGIVPLKYPVTFDHDDVNAFDLIRWYADQHVVNCELIVEQLGPTIEMLHKHGPVSIQWNLQPFELFGLPSVDNLVLLAMTYPDEFRACCEHIIPINIELCKKVFAADADFVFLGGPGSEMLSPQLYREHLIPDSKIITDFVHSINGLIYTHICSPVQPFLEMGLYNEMGLDLFETLSPPPVGNVESLKDATRVLPESICTRGNIGLDVLLNGTVEDVEKATLKIIEETRGRKHMIAASDYLFYDIPLENVQAVVKTAESYKG